MITRRFELLYDAQQWKRYVVHLGYIRQVKAILRIAQPIDIEFEAYGLASGNAWNRKLTVRDLLEQGRLVPALAEHESGELFYVFVAPEIRLPPQWDVDGETSFHAQPVKQVTWKAGLKVWEQARKAERRKEGKDGLQALVQ